MTDDSTAGGKAKMGRPKSVKHGLKLNLYVDREIKQKLFSMATERRVSISAVVRDLVFAQAKAAAARKSESDPGRGHD